MVNILHDCDFYTPAKQSCKGGILESAYPSGPLAVRRFFLVRLKNFDLRFLRPTVFIIGMEVNHDEKMTPIDFEVTGSKVKITGALTKKSLSAK
jgi:hypothetical protein